MDLTDKRILIVKPSSLGDIVHTFPVVHALKRCYPSCFIGWIVQEPFADLVRSDPGVDEAIPIGIPSTSEPGAGRDVYLKAAKATLGTLARLRRQFIGNPYDVVLDLHASLRSGFLGMVNPGGYRIGFADAKELNPWFQDRKLSTDPDKPHAVDKNLAFVREFGCTPHPADFRISTTDEARNRIQSFLQDVGTVRGRRSVYANPGTRWATKYWTVDHWAALTDMLAHKANTTVVFAGSVADKAYIRSIVDRISVDAIDASGRFSLTETVALLEACDAYVGVDSGPMHMAAFAGIPVIALFGPTDPKLVGPYGNGHLVVRREDLPCLGCRKRSCEQRECLEGLTADQVFQRMVKFLSW